MSVIISLVILIVLFLIVLYYLLRGKRFEPSVPKASVPPRPQETPQPLSELTTVQPRTPETPTQETPIPEAAPTEEKAKELVREEHPEQLTPVEAPAQAPEVGEEVAEQVAKGTAEAKEDVSEAGDVVEKAVEGAVTEAQEEAGEVAAAPAEAKAEAGPPRRDPLEKIKGIGPVYKRRLYEAGIYTFQQLAELSPDQIRAIIQPKSWQKIEPESWIQQARELAASQDEAAS